MALTVNIRQLEQKDQHLKGVLAVEDLDIENLDEMIAVKQPLSYDLLVEQMDNAVLVQGRLSLTLNCQCVRCLTAFEYRLDLDPWVSHLPLEGEEKVPVIHDCVDLTPQIREDILLAFPQHPLCKPECKGLSRQRSDTGHRDERESSATSSVWAELSKIKFK